MDAPGDVLEAVGPVVHGVHAGHVCEQHLRGADVRCCLVEADVLLPRLQREPVSRVPQAVHGLSDDAAGHPANLLLAGRKEGRRRAAKPHGHTEPLHRTHHDVCPKLTGRLGNDERQRVCGDNEVRPVLVQRLPKPSEVLQPTGRVRVLYERPAELCHCRKVGAVMVANNQLHAKVVGTGLHDRNGLRMHLVTHEELVLLLRVHGARDHRHGLGGGRALVQQGGVGHLHARQLGHKRLVVHQRLQAALRDLGLIGGVRRVPAGVLQEVAEDGTGDMRAVVAHADEVLRDHVPGEDRLQQCKRTGLSDLPAGQVERQLTPDLCRDGLLDELVEIPHTDDAAHLGHRLRRRSEVPAREGVGRQE
mmetsp:Transcript_69105/g.205649  ORF Transcript_69105/g.205649 Transcript_69105/m.205649 type:complete len:362 (-) Transcript_69105:317-1402(-)